MVYMRNESEHHCAEQRPYLHAVTRSSGATYRNAVDYH